MIDIIFLMVLVVGIIWVTAFALLIPEPYASLLYIRLIKSQYRLIYGYKWQEKLIEDTMEEDI